MDGNTMKSGQTQDVKRVTESVLTGKKICACQMISTLLTARGVEVRVSLSAKGYRAKEGKVTTPCFKKER